MGHQGLGHWVSPGSKNELGRPSRSGRLGRDVIPGRLSGKEERELADFQHDLPDMVAGFHPGVRGSGLRQRISAVDHRL